MHRQVSTTSGDPFHKRKYTNFIRTSKPSGCHNSTLPTYPQFQTRNARNYPSENFKSKSGRQTLTFFAGIFYFYGKFRQPMPVDGCPEQAGPYMD